MIHVIVLESDEGKICINVDNDDDLQKIMADGSFIRELSENEIRQYGMAGYERYVFQANAVVNEDGTVTFTPPAPEPETPEEVIKRYSDAVQDALDAFAQTRRYDGIMSACSYASSTDPIFAAEAAYCITLRDETWRQAYSIMDAVIAGTHPMPTVAELLSELPVGSAQWPNAAQE